MNYIKEFYLFTKLLSRISGKVIKDYFRKEIFIESKTDNSPVTIADKKSEELMREAIMKEYPEHGIIGEEFGEYNVNSDFIWTLDPIDGTKSFISGTVNFGTLIALSYKNIPVLGVFNQPVLNEFLIGDNNKSLLNEISVEVRKVGEMEESTLLATDQRDISKYRNGEKFDELLKRVKIYRTWGDCYGYYLLATGYADIMVDPLLKIWDIAAIVPIVRGAKGVITDYYGNDPIKGNSAIASNPMLHSKIVEMLS